MANFRPKQTLLNVSGVYYEDTLENFLKPRRKKQNGFDNGITTHPHTGDSVGGEGDDVGDKNELNQ